MTAPLSPSSNRRRGVAEAGARRTPHVSDATLAACSLQRNADCAPPTATTVQRRRFLVLTPLALAGCVTSASDESGPRNPPTTPVGGEQEAGTERKLRIVDSSVDEGEEGSLVLSLTVENSAPERRSDTLVGTATVDGTDYDASEALSLPGESEATAALRFDVGYTEWEQNGSLSYGWASKE